ncbi:MAG: DNA polymerase III subunit delta' [Erythrobacter sp.]|uniref:DNA polymerase III subunit delta' n=1 Tax=Erythrobacter sp. TaxID=1042 RepID=UPI002634FBFE|nr:DNA polymerase III subunit delta' [Erythrobacter sp.]MDJ0977743.1 DNA polymerase III subunit delta' [Erythrobacter sp.]
MSRWPNHDGPWREWRSALSGSRMHHGWILAGKAGLGKREFAHAAARELVAEPGAAQPGEHPDILHVTFGPKDDKEERKRENGKPYELSRVIRVREIRAMQRRLTTRPTLGRRRAIVIDPADDMNTEAANALLKSLEEPPEGTFFLLVTHRPSRLLPTIRSRCRVLRFRSLSEDELAAMLAEEGFAPDPAALHAAGGSYGAAVRFVEEDLAPIARMIDGLLTVGDPGFVARSELSRLIGARADRARVQAVFDLAQGMTAERARRAETKRLRAALIDAHQRLAKLAAQAPTHNYDPGLLTLEIGTLLVSAHAASEPAHGSH